MYRVNITIENEKRGLQLVDKVLVFNSLDELLNKKDLVDDLFSEAEDYEKEAGLFNSFSNYQEALIN